MFSKIAAALVAVGMLAGAMPVAAQEKLTVWWVKGFYKSEDDALFEAIKKFEAKTGVKVELSQYPVQDMIPKTVAALDAIAEVGYGGHFFACAHTMERYRTAFYTPLISDWRNYGTWENDGAKTATERANAVYHETLARYVAPERDPGGMR